MRQIKILMPLIAILVAVGPTAVAAQTPNCDGDGAYSCFLLRVPYGRRDQVLQSHGLTLIDEVSPGRPELVRAAGPSSLLPETALANLKGDPDVTDVELVTVESLAEVATESLANEIKAAAWISTSISGLFGGDESAHFAVQMWNGYAAQPALADTEVPQAHDLPYADSMGQGVIAVIDTGVDPQHPLLEGALVPGYDFLLDQAGMASEWSALADPVATELNLQAAAEQSFSGIVEGNGVGVTTYSTVQPIVEQSFSGIVEDNSLPSGFGHGTMVSGIIRLVAPAAQIMPLRAFDGNGLGNTADVIEAIYYAIDNGALVINMSFSVPRHSKELERAIMTAKRKGVVCVSSSGNAGTDAMTYPAGYGYVLGVASSDAFKGLSAFSNYGADLVSLAAPGEEVITLYPGGLYAAAWGTSFSAAFISGTVALLHDNNGSGIRPAGFNNADEWLGLGADETVPGNPDPDGDGVGPMGRGLLDALASYSCGNFGLYCPSS